MEYKISVIIPIYNSALYLKQCVDSLMKQDIDEIEYIFINDASTDGSLSVLNSLLKNYPNKHSRIINLEKNGGISNARNIGLKYAKGEYVTHCDSDDWVDANMYSTLYQLATSNNADIVACNFVDEYKNYYKIHFQPYSTNMEENIRRLLNGDIFPSLWASIIRRELISSHEIGFPKNLNMGEDLLFNVKAYLFANKIIHSNIPYYHYRHTNNSVCVRRSRKSIDSDIIIARCIEDFLTENGYNEIFKKEIAYRKFFSKQALIRNFDNKEEYYEWLNIYPETHKRILSYNKIEPKLRFMLWLASKHLFIASVIIKKFLNLQHSLRNWSN